MPRGIPVAAAVAMWNIRAYVLDRVQRYLRAHDLLDRRQHPRAEEEVERAPAPCAHRVHTVQKLCQLGLLHLR